MPLACWLEARSVDRCPPIQADADLPHRCATRTYDDVDLPALNLDPDVLDWLVVLALALGALGLLLGLLAQLRLRRLRRSYSVLQGDRGTEDFVTAVERKVAEVERLRAEVAGARSDLAATRADVADAIRHVAVVRYDAFGDMGGRLSFSAALLDDAGDGLVLTSINGRSETRTYAKGVKGGASEQQLSPEEDQAIAYARRGTRPARRSPKPAERRTDDRRDGTEDAERPA